MKCASCHAISLKEREFVLNFLQKKQHEHNQKLSLLSSKISALDHEKKQLNIKISSLQQDLAASSALIEQLLQQTTVKGIQDTFSQSQPSFVEKNGGIGIEFLKKLPKRLTDSIRQLQPDINFKGGQMNEFSGDMQLVVYSKDKFSLERHINFNEKYLRKYIKSQIDKIDFMILLNNSI